MPRRVQRLPAPFAKRQPNEGDVYQVCLRRTGIVGHVLLPRGAHLSDARAVIDAAQLCFGPCAENTLGDEDRRGSRHGGSKVPYVFLRGVDRCTRESERTTPAGPFAPVLLLCELHESENQRSTAELGGTLHFTPAAAHPVRGAFAVPARPVLDGGEGAPLCADVGHPLAMSRRGGAIRPFFRHRFYRNKAKGGRGGSGGGSGSGSARGLRQRAAAGPVAVGADAGESTGEQTMVLLSRSGRRQTPEEKVAQLQMRRAAGKLKMRLLRAAAEREDATRQR